MAPTPEAIAAEDAARDPLAVLPLPLALHLFSLLPADARLCCTAVCRGWRAALRDPRTWTRLDLRATRGTTALLRAAAAHAAGGLQTLIIDGCDCMLDDPSLLQVVAANAGSLRELSACATDDEPPAWLSLERVAALLAAAPLLRSFETDVSCDAAAVRPLLRNEPPYGPLRVRSIAVSSGCDTPADVLALAADAAAHTWLRSMELWDIPLDAPGTLDAVVDAALARRMHSILLGCCNLSPSSAPALTRLLGGGALAELSVVGSCRCPTLLDAPSAALLAAALRANTTLAALTLRSVGLSDEPAACATLLGALAGHASLESLDISGLCGERPPLDDEAVLLPLYAPLGALVAANAAALRSLDVSYCELGDAGLTPLVDALPGNTHLRALACGGNGLSRGFERHRFLPAVRANTGLRELTVDEEDGQSAHKAEDAVLRRATAASERL